MRKFCNEKAQQLKQGTIRELFDRAVNYTDTINMGIGEPDFDTPDYIIKAGCRALEEGKTRYTANAGLFSLRQSVLSYLKKFDIEFESENNIIITNGGMGALSLCMQCVISSGDEVLVQDPCWLNYRSQIEFLGGVVVSVPVYEENGFCLTADSIEAKMTDRTRILLLNSPNNPTGAVISSEELKRIAELAIKYDLLVISDEVYCELIYGDRKHCSIAEIPEMQERTVVVNSLSKSFAMTGWRVGYAAGPEAIIRNMVLLQENMVACVTSSSQYGALGALTQLGSEIKMMLDTYDERRSLIVAGLNRIPGISCNMPPASFYVFPNIKATGLKSAEFSDRLLQETGVIAIPGSAFGNNGEGYLRLSYANSKENILKALERIEGFIGGIK